MVTARTFAQSARTFADLVDRLPDDGWNGPGLGEWSLRSLVGHANRALVTVDTYLDRPAEAEQLHRTEDYYVAVAGLDRADAAAVTERGRAAGEALGPHPAAAVRNWVDRVLPRVETAEDPVIETIAGGMRLSTYLPTRSVELVVHSFDIAQVSGVAPQPFTAEVLGDVCEVLARAAAAGGRAGELIMALTGRRRLPADFSVV